MGDMTHVRMDPKLKKKIHEYIKSVEEREHVKIGFSEAVRSLIERGINSVREDTK